MLLILLLLSTVFINAYVCPTGYTDGFDGNCYSGPYYGAWNRNDAYKTCSNDNAYLYTVNTPFDNQRVQNRAGSIGSIWLGLTCLGNDVTTCQWDSGKDLLANDYSNFYNNRPNASDGACVVMQTKTGQWYSADCSNQANIYFECKYTPGVDIPTCPDYYNGGLMAAPLRGKCYFVDTNYNVVGGTQRCRSIGGDMASIHSLGEDSFIRGLLKEYSSSSLYAYLGLKWTGPPQNYTWTDGSRVDYKNFGYENQQLGSCVSLAINNDVVPSGYWISSQCSQNLPIVCKHDPVPVTPVSTLSPSMCSGTDFVSNYGRIYSPGYPEGSLPNHCEYLITEDEQNQVQVVFNDVHLDSHSSISLYNSFFDLNPFAKLTNTNYGGVYISSGNMLKVVFNTGGSENFNNKWNADYSPYFSYLTTEYPVSFGTTSASNCDGWYYYSGEITSPGYPGSYASVTQDCSYYLDSQVSRTCFTFNDLNLRYYDYVTLYDGYPWNNYELASFTGSSSGDGIYCTSRYRYMTVVFSTYSYNSGNVRGFSGRFASDANALYYSTTSGSLDYTDTTRYFELKQ